FDRRVEDRPAVCLAAPARAACRAMADPRLRDLPSVDRLLSGDAAQAWLRVYARPFVVEQARAVLEQARAAIKRGASVPSTDELNLAIEAGLRAASARPLRPLVN